MDETLTDNSLVKICPECGAENSPDEKICYSCGHLLVKYGGSETHRLEVHDVERLERAKPIPATETQETLFPVGKTLKLKMRELDDPLVYSLDEGSLLMGRRDKDSDYTPDIDFYPFAGYLLGVSRKHAVLHRIDDQIVLEDLGSSNGTFVDGERLNRNEQRVIYSGVELGLGDLHFTVFF